MVLKCIAFSLFLHLFIGECNCHASYTIIEPLYQKNYKYESRLIYNIDDGWMPRKFLVEINEQETLYRSGCVLVCPRRFVEQINAKK